MLLSQVQDVGNPDIAGVFLSVIFATDIKEGSGSSAS